MPLLQNIKDLLAPNVKSVNAALLVVPSFDLKNKDEKGSSLNFLEKLSYSK